jgi:hypothetical protein
MPMRQLQLQCAKCDAIQPHNQPTPNHVVHALVSLFALGLWVPVWIIIAMGSGNAEATCVKCNNRRTPQGAATVSRGPAEYQKTSAVQIVWVIVVCLAAVFGLMVYDRVSRG